MLMRFSALFLALSVAFSARASDVSVGYDKDRQQVFASAGNTRVWIDRTTQQVEGTCSFVDAAGNHNLFLVAEEGHGSQWVVADRDGLLPRAMNVRFIALPPTATSCVVDRSNLYVNEEGVGIWRYPADADAETARKPVFLDKDVAAFTVVDGRLITHEPGTANLRLHTGSDVSTVSVLELSELDVEGLSSLGLRKDGKLKLRVNADEGDYDIAIDWPAVTPLAAPSVPVVAVHASAETEPVARMGDAADDPAIWHNGSVTRILGTDKQGGLQVFDLNGKRLQDLRVGRLNNVDVRDNFAAASNRDKETLDIFRISPAGVVSPIAQIPTAHKEIYGLCMAKDTRNRIYVIANQKDGTFMQYALSNSGTSARLVRTFKVASQPEGCVASSTQLFVGEEAAGVYVLPLDPTSRTPMQKVIAVGDVLHKDVEGLALYGNKYLIVSSQGNDSYVVLDAIAPYRIHGVFRVMASPRSGIDGVSETDGLEVTSANLGGIYSRGMFVAQDGRNRMPEAPQNFKYVPWQVIADAMKLSNN